MSEDALEETDFTYAADALWNLLRRSWPEEMGKDELLQESGLETAEARGGLKLLEKTGRLDETSNGLKAKVDGEAGDPLDLGGAEEKEEGAETEDPAEAPSPPPTTAPVAGRGGATHHAYYDVSVAYGSSPGQSEEASVKAARAMEVEIADRIHQLYPGAVVGVELSKIEVYDKPREIPLKGDE